MTTLGIIGSGNIGTAIARLAVKADIRVVIANSRGPESLRELIDELGPLAVAGTTQQAIDAGDIVVLTVPLGAVTSFPRDLLDGKTVLDTTNYYPHRDGRIPELDENRLTASELVQQHFAGAGLTKAFNNILAHHIPLLAREQGASDRTALPLWGDDAETTSRVGALVERLGFDALDAGTASESWRSEPESSAYTRLYLADPATPDEQLRSAPAAPVSTTALRDALAQVERVDVATRQF